MIVLRATLCLLDCYKSMFTAAENDKLLVVQRCAFCTGSHMFDNDVNLVAGHNETLGVAASLGFNESAHKSSATKTTTDKLLTTSSW